MSERESWDEEPCPATDCYRCWQVGRRDVPGVVLVTYNADLVDLDSKSRWTSPSCEACLIADRRNFPNRLVVSALKPKTEKIDYDGQEVKP
jgi:hypothetical protein